MEQEEEYIIIGIPVSSKDRALIALSNESIGVDLFREGNISTELSFVSKLSITAPVFDVEEKFLSDCYKVFKYYNSVEVFNSLDCERKTGVTRWHCNKIYDKYLKNNL